MFAIIVKYIKNDQLVSVRFFSQESKEEWIAVAYGSLMYIGCVLQEREDVITVRFLRRADGFYEFMKNDDEVEKALVFMRGITVTWQGIGRYDVPDMKQVVAEHKRHNQMLRMVEKVTCVLYRCGEMKYSV